MLAGLLKAERMGDEIETAAAKSEADALDAAEKIVSEPPLISRLAAGNPRFQPIIAKFAGRLSEQLDRMAEAWSVKDFDEIARLAHWLKGAGGTVGFDAFTEPAAELEQLAKAKSPDQIEQTLAGLRRLAGRISLPADIPPTQSQPNSERTDPALIAR
jgi:HPt (histidine-containing phosphotransfer) domain-containing protein